MLGSPSFQEIIIKNDNFENSKYSTYTLEIVTNIPFWNDDSFFMTFPPELTLPTNPVCDHDGTVFRTLRCSSPSPNRLKVNFYFMRPLLNDHFRFQMRVFNVRNPPSTKTTSNFRDIEAHDSRGYRISWWSPVGPTMRNLFPSITQGVLTQGSKELGATTDYTITYQTVNKMPANATFLINYPLSIEVP
jgi:hypothetical protein